MGGEYGVSMVFACGGDQGHTTLAIQYGFDGSGAGGDADRRVSTDSSGSGFCHQRCLGSSNRFTSTGVPLAETRQVLISPGRKSASMVQDHAGRAIVAWVAAPAVS